VPETNFAIVFACIQSYTSSYVILYVSLSNFAIKQVNLLKCLKEIELSANI